MKVIFYEIYDCEYELLNDKPAIIAPYCTDDYLLKKYRFIQLLDGRWVHYMTEREIVYMSNNLNESIINFNNCDEIYRLSDSHKPAPQHKNDPAKILLLFIITFMVSYLIWSVVSCINECNECKKDIKSFPDSCQESQD